MFMKAYAVVLLESVSETFLTLCILMDFPIQIHIIRMGVFIIYFKGSTVTMYFSPEDFINSKQSRP